MNDFFIFSIVFLIILLLIGFIRIFLGPTAIDRVLALQLFGTISVAIIILLSTIMGESFFIVALVFALLSAITSIAFIKRVWV